MTSTLERWWTPAATVPLSALLVSGGDGRKDLAQGLFALHRAGAEACELVAKTAVADETVLLAALAETRLLVAPQALDVVSKGVESPQYAGLLVRDLLDDAESSALALYRTCLAKSVAPPVAAQRVGMVYGVPGRELGRYASFATDPKANPMAVQDAADRALFGYIAKVVEQEHVPAKEDVSKEGERSRERIIVDRFPKENKHHTGPPVRQRPQTQTEGGGVTPDDPATEYYDAREQTTGRFARTGLSKPGLAPVLGPTTAGPSRLGQREGRQARIARTPRVAREQTPLAGQAELARQTALVSDKVNLSSQSALARERSKIAQEKSRVMMSATALAMQQVALAHLDEPEPAPKPHGLGDIPDTLTEMDDPNRGEHQALDQSLGFAMPSERWTELVRAAAEGDLPTDRIMLAGALEQFAGAPERFHTEVDAEGNVVVHEDHEQSMAQVAQLAHANPERAGQPELYVKRLPTGLTRGMGRAAIEQQLAEEKKDLLREYQAWSGQGGPMMREMGYVDAVPAYDDDEAWVLVYRPPPEGGSLGKRPAPNVTEVMIPEDVARGIDNAYPGATHSDYLIDRNQGLKIAKREVFFDVELGVYRSKVTMAEVDRDTLDRARDRREGAQRGPWNRWEGGKSLSRERFRELERSGEIVRDQEGQFATTEEARVQPRLSGGLTPSLARGRQPRKARQARTSLTGQVQLSGGQTSLGQQTALGRQSQLAEQARLEQHRAKIESSVALERQATAGLAQSTSDGRLADSRLPVDDDHTYRVVDQDLMAAMAADDHAGFPEARSKPWALGWRSHSALLEHSESLVGGDAESELRARHLDAHNVAALSDDQVDVGDEFLYRTTLLSPRDLWKVESQINKAMDNRPDVSVLTAHLVTLARGRGMHVELLVNKKPLPPQHLVREPETFTDRPMRLVPEGEYRMHDQRTVRAWLEMVYAAAKEMGSFDGWLTNPRVVTWRLEEQP